MPDVLPLAKCVEDQACIPGAAGIRCYVLWIERSSYLLFTIIMIATLAYLQPNFQIPISNHRSNIGAEFGKVEHNTI
jgi:hypothetical protein